jgi:hypothetical protein
MILVPKAGKKRQVYQKMKKVGGFGKACSDWRSFYAHNAIAVKDFLLTADSSDNKITLSPHGAVSRQA